MDIWIELSKRLCKTKSLFHQVYAVKGCLYLHITVVCLSCAVFCSCHSLFFCTASGLCPLQVPEGNKKKKIMWLYLAQDAKRTKESFLRTLFMLLCFQPQLSKSKQRYRVEEKCRLPAQIERLFLCLVYSVTTANISDRQAVLQSSFTQPSDLY